MKGRLLGLLFIMALLSGFMGREASAYKVKVEVEKTGPYAEKISDEMFEFARKETISWIKDYVENEDGEYDDWTVFVGLDVTKKVAERETFTLCKPYTYWTCDDDYLFPTYMFPVAVDGSIVSLLEVSGRIEDSDYICSRLRGQEKKEEIESLNKLDYLHRDYAIFYYQGKTMAADENNEITTVVKCYERSLDERTPFEKEAAFYALDYKEKIEAALEQMDNFMYQKELDALRERLEWKQRESEVNGENPRAGGTWEQAEDTDTAVRETEDTKPDKHDTLEKTESRSLPIAALAGGAAAVVVLAACIGFFLKKKREKTLSKE